MKRNTKGVVRRFAVLNLAAALALMFATTSATAATIFESGTLGPTGIPRGVVPGANVSSDVFNGVRFELATPVITTQVGGHFVGSVGTTDTLFGAIVKLADENDYPDSADLSTPDVLGSTKLTFPEPSAEVFGDLSLSLDPGWYALVFGSGLFGASGNGAMPLNNPDIGNPTYIGFQSGTGWFNLSTLSDAFEFEDYRFVVKGTAIPEPATVAIALMAFFSYLFYWLSYRRKLATAEDDVFSFD